MACADRAQAPSGTGYALENRIVLSRVCPRPFAIATCSGSERSIAHRDGLTALAPANRRDHPRVVLLTPGPSTKPTSSTRISLDISGSPSSKGRISPCDSRVFIKTLEGLRQVDVILRRLDDSFCDPLELRPDSALGVAGLMEAVRAGTSRWQTRWGPDWSKAAVAAFLPALCRHLLGEELLLSPARSWWCGHGRSAMHFAHLDELVIKPSFPPATRQPVFGRCSVPSRKALRSALRARPRITSPRRRSRPPRGMERAGLRTAAARAR